MNEYEVIIEENLDSFFENASTKEDYNQIVEALVNALKRAKEERAEFVEDGDEDEEFEDEEE